MPVAQSRDDSRNHGVVQRRWGSHLICDLYLNKAVLEQRKQVTLVEEGEGGIVMFAASQESAGFVPKPASHTCACGCDSAMRDGL